MMLIETKVSGPTTTKRASRRRSSSSFSSSTTSRERQYVDHSYTDHLHSPLFKPGDNDHHDQESSGAPKRRGPRGGVVVPFPERLYNMLSCSESDGFEQVVSWQPHGRCFIVHKPKEFVEQVMPRFFRQSKLTSFQRQVNLYGFRRLTAGKDRGGYYHEMFLRGRPDLHKALVRIRVKGTGFKSASNPASEPDFYTFPRCGGVESAQMMRLEENSEVVAMPPLATEPLVDDEPKKNYPPPLLNVPMDPAWKPLSAPPKMVAVAPHLKLVESLSDLRSITDTTEETCAQEPEWCRSSGKIQAGSNLSLASMAQSIASGLQSPCPVSPESSQGRQIFQALQIANAAEDSSPASPLPSVVSLVDDPQSPISYHQQHQHQHQHQHQQQPIAAVPALPEQVESRMNSFQEGIDALLAADLCDWPIEQNMWMDNSAIEAAESYDPLFLLDEVAGFAS